MSYLAVPEASHRALIRPAHLVATASAGAVVVLAVALIASASFLHDLGVAAGLGPWLAWSLPVALDASAACALVLWVFGPRGAVRAQARALTLGALVATLVGNEVSHLVTGPERVIGPGSITLVLGVGAVIPVVAAAWAHLVATLIASLFDASGDVPADQSPAPEVAQAPVVDASADASAIDQRPAMVGVMSHLEVGCVDASRGASVRRRRSTPAVRRRWIAARLDAGEVVTGGRVERHFGSRNGAREVGQVLADRAA